jgi:hypothetical protein
MAAPNPLTVAERIAAAQRVREAAVTTATTAAPAPCIVIDDDPLESVGSRMGVWIETRPRKLAAMVTTEAPVAKVPRVGWPVVTTQLGDPDRDEVIPKISGGWGGKAIAGHGCVKNG